MMKSTNRSGRVQHCDNDHYCCQQSKLNESLSRSIVILREQIARLQKQKKFLEEVNVSLMRDFDKKVQESLQQQQKEALKRMTEMQLDYEERLQSLQEKLDNIERDYTVKLKEQTDELNSKLQEQLTLVANLLSDKHLAQQKISELTALSKEQAEEIQKIKLSKESEEATTRGLREEIDNLERDKASVLMKVEGYSLALKSLEQKYTQLSDRLVVEETHRKQAMIGMASKESMVRSLENEISQQSFVRDRLLQQNKALQNIVNSLDSHVFDLRKNEYGMMKELQDVHQLAAHKQNALEGIKRDLHTLKFSV